MVVKVYASLLCLEEGNHQKKANLCDSLIKRMVTHSISYPLCFDKINENVRCSKISYRRTLVLQQRTTQKYDKN